MGLDDPNISPPVSVGGLLRRSSQVLYSGARGRTRTSGCKLKREVQSGCEEKGFPCEDSQAVKQKLREAAQSPSLEVFKAQLIKC